MAKVVLCDKCGLTGKIDSTSSNPTRDMASLVVMYNYPYSTFGTKHLCEDCQVKFKLVYDDFFKKVG